MKFLTLISQADNGFVLKIVSPNAGDESRVYAFESVEAMCKFIMRHYAQERYSDSSPVVKWEWTDQN